MKHLIIHSQCTVRLNRKYHCDRIHRSLVLISQLHTNSRRVWPVRDNTCCSDQIECLGLHRLSNLLSDVLAPGKRLVRLWHTEDWILNADGWPVYYDIALQQ